MWSTLDIIERPTWSWRRSFMYELQLEQSVTSSLFSSTVRGSISGSWRKGYQKRSSPSARSSSNTNYVTFRCAACPTAKCNTEWRPVHGKHCVRGHPCLANLNVCASAPDFIATGILIDSIANIFSIPFVTVNSTMHGNKIVLSEPISHSSTM